MASRIFADRWLDLFLEGRVDAVLDAVEQLPETSVYSSEAHLAKALILGQRGSLDAARSELDAARAQRTSFRRPPGPDSRTEWPIVELFRTGYDRGPGSAVESGAALLDRMDRSQRAPDPAIRASVQVFVGMGEARLQSHPKLPLEMLRSSAATAHDTGLVALELTALAESCLPAIAEGRLSEVRDLAASVLARAEERGWVGLVTLAPAVAYLGWFDYWRGNLREARAQLERSLSMVLPFDWELRGLILNFLTKTCLSLGDLRAARRNAAEIRSMIESGHVAPSWPSMLAGPRRADPPGGGGDPRRGGSRLPAPSRPGVPVGYHPQGEGASPGRASRGGAGRARPGHDPRRVRAHPVSLALPRGRGARGPGAGGRRPRVSRARPGGSRAGRALRAIPRCRRDHDRAAQVPSAPRHGSPHGSDPRARPHRPRGSTRTSRAGASG